MSQEKVQIMRDVYDAFNRGDLDGFVALFDADCEYRPALETQVEGSGGVFRGHDGMRSWWRGMYEAWSEFGVEIHEIRDLGEQGLVLGVFHGRAWHTGMVLESPNAQVFTCRAGRIAATQDFFDQDAALKAVGLER